ncbi:MAG: hypothetical protein KatS3mg110_0505 [Pirellulaceae bacterium]|nr:MAG: hypothetical protein KatS3mg110_0505 [Pirellulaceae bacterium]
MAREIESRLWLRGELVAKSPIHVGGLGDDVDTDLPLAVNGAGDFYVPGTSLAGSIRQYVEERFGDDLAHCLWGYQTKEDGKASHVVVEDGVLLNPDEVPPEIRDGVGIDRQWGAAAEHIKYDRAVLPKGTRIDFAMYVEVPDGDQRSEALAMLAEIRRALQEGLIRLGAGKTRGLGYVELVDSQITEQSYKHRNDLWDSLISRFGSVVPEEEIQKAHNSNSGERPAAS